MRRTIRRIGHDLKSRRHVEAYVVAALALFFAVVSLAGDIAPDGARWAVLLGGVGILVYRVTLPEGSSAADDLLHDRTTFESVPFASRLEGAREVWIFAPSAVNLLSPQHCDALRSKVLCHSTGVLRIVVLDPTRAESLLLASRQLDDSVDYPVQTLEPSLNTTLRQLRLMSRWPISGNIQYRVLGYNPGFSLVAIDPGARHGTIIVEFHGFHNEATTSRMHLELTRHDSHHWYSYWADQFDHIWHASRDVDRA